MIISIALKNSNILRVNGILLCLIVQRFEYILLVLVDSLTIMRQKFMIMKAVEEDPAYSSQDKIETKKGKKNSEHCVHKTQSLIQCFFPGYSS